MRFPELHARDLDGRPVTLPDDLGSGPTLLLVSFTPQVTPDVETWLPVAAELTDAVPDFWCYDLLVLPEFPDPVESSLAAYLHVTDGDGGTDDASRSLTAHTDLAAFRRALVLDRLDRVYALVLRDGRVEWRAFGPLTTALERRLHAAVEKSTTGDGSDDFVAS
jgi:hypothetical protein